MSGIGFLEHAVSSAPATAHDMPSGLELASARGSWVSTTDGRRLLDLTSAMAACGVGHSHPAVIGAVRAQLAALVQAGGMSDHGPRAELAERLRTIAPPGIDTFSFGCSGSEAVDMALGLARAATGRSEVICFAGGYHGRTRGSAAVTTATTEPGLPGDGESLVAPFPHSGRGGDAAAAAASALAGLDRVRSGRRPAAYVVEPVQGFGGCHPAGAAFLRGLRERCDCDGALLVFDEVQTGLGRTGDWFAAGTYAVAPDVVCLAKGLGGGLPISAVGARRALWERAPTAARGGTFGGSPLSCAAALAVLETIESEGLCARAAGLGRTLAAELDRLAAPRVWLAGRGLGLMAGLEVRTPAGRPDPGRAEALRRRCLDLGVVVGRAGRHGNVVRLLPPLTISQDELALGLQALERALQSIEARSPHLALAA